MDKLAMKVKHAHDIILPMEARLTEDEKESIRRRVAGLRTYRPKKKRDLVPKALTAAVAAGFLLFVGGMVGKELAEQDNKTNGSKSLEQGNQHLVINVAEQEAAEKMLRILPGKEKQKVEIREDSGVSPSTDKFIYVQHEDGNDSRQEQKLTTDKKGQLVLPQHLQEIYNQYSITPKESLLKELVPLDIMQLYYFAEEQKDYKTQYSLFIDDPEYEKVVTYAQFTADMKNPESLKARENLLETIKAAKLEEKITSATDAHIVISKETGLGFGLIKNKNGIWKVKWMPLQ